MTYFIVYEPALLRIRFVKTDCCATARALRKRLRLLVNDAQIFKLSERKYNYVKVALK